MGFEHNIVSYPVAMNCMKLIADGAATDAFEALGISEFDFELVTGHSPWLGSDRSRVTSVLNSLTHGVLDVLALPRIEVPAEFRAGVISCFVAPSNLAVACRWLETGPTAEDIISGGQLEAVSGRQLFALCCQLSSSAPTSRAAWLKRTGRAVAAAMGTLEGNSNGLSQEVSD